MGGSSEVCGKVHEASMVHRLDSVPLHEALSQSTQAGGRGSEPIDELAQESNEGVLMVGALDSASNRTCCGTQWLGSHLRQIHRLAPSTVSSLVESEDEQERFKFGNGGVLTSSKRWRLPACVGGKLVLI